MRIFMSEDERTEWLEFKTEIRGDIKEIRNAQTKIGESVVRLETIITGLPTENAVHKIAAEKVDACKDHRNETSEVTRKALTDLKNTLSAAGKANSGFWSGMTAAQKMTVITTTLGALGSTVALVVQNI